MVERGSTADRLCKVASMIALGTRPEAVIQHDIYTESKATRPYWLQQVEDGDGLFLKDRSGRVFAVQTCHPLVGSETHSAMAAFKLFSERRFSRTEEAEQEVCCRFVRCHRC